MRLLLYSSSREGPCRIRNFHRLANSLDRLGKVLAIFTLTWGCLPHTTALSHENTSDKNKWHPRWSKTVSLADLFGPMWHLFSLYICFLENEDKEPYLSIWLNYWWNIIQDFIVNIVWFYVFLISKLQKR